MKISVIGTGYVGLVSGACFSQIGHTCICVDVDQGKVDRINAGKATIHEHGLDELIARHAGKSLFATTDLTRAVLDTDITFIAVGTPFDGRTIDLSYIREAARQIGEALKKKASYHVIVVKSTVVPGTTDDVVLPILEMASGKRAGVDFGVAMNPEFLTEGTAITDFMEPDRIVIGGIDAASLAALREVYAPFATTPALETNNKTAEMIKYASNSVLAAMISFSNEIGNLCWQLGGIDVADVMRGVHLARYFTVQTPEGKGVPAPITSFLWAGCGYGGSCLPKDTKALASHAEAHGLKMPLLNAVIETNAGQSARITAMLTEHFAKLDGLRVTLLGLAFKQDTDDMRESPAIGIAEALAHRGVRLTAYDPVAKETARAALSKVDVAYADSMNAAVADADAIVLITRWDEFRELPAVLAARSRTPLVIDGRRMLDRTAVPNYAGIGYRPLKKVDNSTAPGSRQAAE